MEGSSPIREIKTKISKSKMSAETKEIFSVLLAFFTSIQAEKDAKIEKLQNEIVELRTNFQEFENKTAVKLNELQGKIDETEQYERKDALVISGPNLPEFSAGENLKTKIQKLFSDHLSIQLNSNDFSIAHRLGQKPRNGVDRRNIIFKLCRRELVSEIFKQCKQLKPPFFVNVSLTPLRGKILYALRQCKQQHPDKVGSCRNIDGNVVLYTKNSAAENSSRPRSSNSENKRFINSRSELEKTLQDLGIPLESISRVNW